MIATLFAAALVSDLPQSWIRQWTVSGGSILGIRDGSIYFTNDKGIGALAADGALKWNARARGYSNSVMGERAIFGTQGEFLGDLTLTSWDLRDGKAQVYAKGDFRNLAIDDTRLFASPTYGQGLEAYDQATGKLLWRNQAPSGSLSTAAGNVVVCANSGGYMAYDAATGTPRWTTLTRGRAPALLAPNGSLILGGEELIAVDPKTGARRWKLDLKDTEPSVFAGNTLVTSSGAKTYGISCSNGKILFQFDQPREQLVEPFASVAQDRVWIAGPPARVIDERGTVVWSSNQRFYEAPVVSGETLVLTDRGRLMAYAPGSQELPESSADKKALAKRLVATYEDLDESERDLLIPLAPYATDLLLDRIPGWYLQSREWTWYPHGELYSRVLDSIERRLDKMVTPANGPKLMWTAYRMGLSSFRNKRMLRPIYEKNVDLKMAAPLLTKVVLEHRSDPATVEVELEMLAKSGQPEAIGFFVAALEDPNAPPEWRRAAMLYLGAFGGEKGLAAVRLERAQREPRAPWFKRWRFYESNLDQVAKDRDGKEWGLFYTGILGVWRDRLIARKTPAGWADPVYLGSLPNKVPASDWLNRLHRPETLRDTDGDNLTDLAEKTLGTPFDDPDADDDGLTDAVDPFPLTAPRANLTDREKILAAAVEGFSFESQWKIVTHLKVAGVRPFEFHGFPGTLFWGDKGGHGELRVGADGQADWLQLGPDGRTAKVTVSYMMSGIGETDYLDLVKIGDDWFVTRIETTGSTLKLG